MKFEITLEDVDYPKEDATIWVSTIRYGDKRAVVQGAILPKGSLPDVWPMVQQKIEEKVAENKVNT